MITKGIRISQLVERKDLNGKEIIPFQDGIHNGKLSIQSLIDYIGDISDSDVELQALIKIQKFVDTVSEMDLLLYQAKEGDIYYCKENKKLYVRSFNKWDMLDPLTSKVYVLVGLDEYNRTNIIHLWDGNDMVVMSERLFIGEVTGTAYDGGKGKATTDVVNSLSDNLVNDVLVSQSDKNSVSLTIKSITKNPVKKNKELLLVDGEPILLTDNTPILLVDNVNGGLYNQADDKLITINQASSFTAGVMSASDKTKLDGLKVQAEIDASISNVQGNLNAHINNRTNPHKVTKEQIGLSQVDNTSDANKPISKATQTALNGKFGVADGNALKQTIENMPNLVVTEGSVSHKNNNMSLSLRQRDLKNPVNTDSILLTFNPATDSTAGVMSASDKTKLDGLKVQAEIDASISNVQGNLNAHINNRTNPHKVTKEQIGLSQVDNTSDANKPISKATQTALNGKFGVADGNALKQTIENMPNLVVTEGSVSHKNNNMSLSLRQRDLKNPVNTDSILLTFNPATDSTAGIILPSDKSKIDKIITNGNGTKYLSDNGTYKEVSGGSGIHNFVLDKHRDNRKVVSLVGEGFDESHWYPVSFVADPNTIVPPCNLIIWNSLNNDSAGINPKPSWATNTGGFVLHIDMTIIGDGYGQYTQASNKLNNWHGEWGGETAVGEIRQTKQISTFYIYLRGGAKYFYTSDYAELEMIAHSSEVLDGYNTYSIKDTQGDIKDFFTYVENDLFKEVKNLQIAHNNEFNFANNSTGDRVWINYRSRYDAITSAKSVYVGNGQAGADGAFGAIHASGFFKESDVRLKSNMAPLNHTLDQICNIPTVEFDMHDKHQIGTVAQDLENNFAEIVNIDSDGMKSVDYCMLGVVAIEGVKLLRQEIEDLKKQLQELKNGK